MKALCLLLAALLFTALPFTTPAATLYVNVNSTNPVAPYTNWATAATAIQDAVDAANPGDLILVTNGLYASAGRAAPDGTTTSVVVTQAIVVESVGGPAATFINGSGAMRCVYLTNGASLAGFTLINGSAQDGGGVYSPSTNTLISNCVLVSNNVAGDGGGACGGTLSFCVLASNSAGYGEGPYDGGGAYGSTLNNCRVLANSSSWGGGTAYCNLNNSYVANNGAWFDAAGTLGGTLNNCTVVSNICGIPEGNTYGGTAGSVLNNCIVYFNTQWEAASNADITTAINFTCVTPLPGSGVGNTSADPQFNSDGLHFFAGSPCRGTGSSAYVSGVDLNGHPWANPPSMGCVEYEPAEETGPISLSVTAPTLQVGTNRPVAFSVSITGICGVFQWTFGDGSVVTNQFSVAHAWTAPGVYPVVCTAYNTSNPGGVSVTNMVSVLAGLVRYVSQNSATAAAPYTNWTTAASNIQDAINVASPGDIILVSNGIYASGGQAVAPYALPNCVAAAIPLTIRSVNGLAVTVIVGSQVFPNFVRCVYLADGCALSGFTLTNGSSGINGVGGDQEGGGVWCATANVVVSNCIITGCSAYYQGGGAYGGNLYNCWVLGNNSQNYGGGVAQCGLNNSYVSANSVWTDGAGAYQSTLNNCTVVSNVCNPRNSGTGAGAADCAVNNCIVYFNDQNGIPNASYSAGPNFTCVTPLPSPGVGNTSANPQLNSDGLHFFASSPCRSTGSAAYASGVDLNGDPWGNPPSVGCLEYVAAEETGPISIGIISAANETGTNQPMMLGVNITGLCGVFQWTFGDGTLVTNQFAVSHAWAAAGNYPVVCTAYNASNPGGVSATNMITVVAATVHLVSQASSAPTPPYTTWSTAATTIQDAINSASSGDVVLVSNGVYQTGGLAVATGGLTNRVAVTKPITVASATGPADTLIVGTQISGSLFGDAAVRCVYLTNGAKLVGFTLTNGATRNKGDSILDQTGGGVFCQSSNVIISNCVITGNVAYNYGGGASGGILASCILSGNTAVASGGGAANGILNASYIFGNTSSNASGGGGVSLATLNSCTVISNSGGGISNCVANNCIIDFNAGSSFSNYDVSSVLNYCCTMPLPPAGTGNIATNPFFAAVPHLLAASPCRGAGNNVYAVGSDLDGQPWLNPPSMGCEEFEPGEIVGPLSVTVQTTRPWVDTNFQIGFAGTVSGQFNATSWSFGDGTLVTNQLTVSHAWSAPGNYSVVFTAFNDSNPAGVSASVVMSVYVGAPHFVNWANTTPQPPFATWATAATNIQDAVDAANSGDIVLVTNGVYATGGRTNAYPLTNRVAAVIPVIVQSVNGPAFTTIEGYQMPGGPWGSNAIRCVYLTNGAWLVGFTLTDGATGSADNTPVDWIGGGVFCEASNCIVSNCVIVGNAAANSGGGAYGGTLYDCIVSNNTAGGNGGGAYSGSLYNCVLANNAAGNYGGGANQSTLNNCFVWGNSAGFDGGGADNSMLNNCTVISNRAELDEGSWDTTSSGEMNCTLNNCILYFNGAGGEYDNFSGAGTLLNYCCTSPLPSNQILPSSGVGNISADPQLTNSFYIGPNSPCRGAGSAAFATGTDLAGNVWSNPPAIGCDEYTGHGPLYVSVQTLYSNVPPGFAAPLSAQAIGSLYGTSWNFGDGTSASNQLGLSHIWASPGAYTVTFAAFNLDYPGGISTSFVMNVGTNVFVHYVSLTSINPIAPYTNWATAATNIQDAIDAAGPGDTVLVTDGIYATGGRVLPSYALMNRVAVDKPITLQSINGPSATVIEGYPVVGSMAVRCVYLTNFSSLIGFTLSNGATLSSANLASDESGGGVYSEANGVLISNCVVVSNSGAASGGGIWCASTNTIVANCTLEGNLTGSEGGGVLGGTLNSCSLIGNSGFYGGAAESANLNFCSLIANNGPYGSAIVSTLNNCLILSNSEGVGAYQCNVTNSYICGNAGGASYGVLNNCTIVSNGSGTFDCTLNNCIDYFNGEPSGPNDNGSTMNYCCTTPLPATGLGNIAANPLLVNGYQVASNSPCRGAGNAGYAQGVDIAGQAWALPPSTGCYEYHPVTGPLNVTIQPNFPYPRTGMSVTFTANLGGSASSILWNFGDGTQASNQIAVSHVWTSTGAFQVVATAFNASNPEGISTTNLINVILPPVHFVSQASATPVSPYTNWTTAANTIQAAIDIATPGDIVLVTNGVYQVGGHPVAPDTLTNRIAVTIPLVIQSVNGPGVTLIQGQVDSDYLGMAARCCYLTNGASLIGFTLTNGGTSKEAGEPDDFNGAGVWCTSTNVIVSNCAILGNLATDNAGGAYGGTFYNCTIAGNALGGGGTIGPGVASGAYGAVLANSLITGNAGTYGGSTYLNSSVVQCTLYNCTVSMNDAGLSDCLAFNSIIVSNPALAPVNYTGSTLAYSCSVPLAPGPGNITADPQLTDSYHIGPNSPCRGAGNAAYASGTDLDGESWLHPPSIGCDEYYGQGPLTVSAQVSSNRAQIGTPVVLIGQATGSQTESIWNFGDGASVTNQAVIAHSWAARGTYLAVFTVYNLDHPGGLNVTIPITISDNPPWLHCVNVNSTNPVAPFTDWDQAATNIQDAVDAATNNDVILVTNGVYAFGGHPYPEFLLTNRVCATNPVAIQSVNGPFVTVIQGFQVPGATNGPSAVRCVCLNNGASLTGFTITSGATLATNGGDGDGGGISGESGYAYISNCIISSNSAFSFGGGAVGNLILRNCLVSFNTAQAGAGLGDPSAVNCTIAYNSAPPGQIGGVFYSTFSNCIVYQNTGGNYSNSGFSYSCTTPLPSGQNNISADPQFLGGPQIAPTSPCRGAGLAAITIGADIYGDAWADPPSMGCVEYNLQAMTGPLSLTVQNSQQEADTNMPITFSVSVTGRPTELVCNFADGTVVTNESTLSHSWTAPGLYPVVFTAFNATYTNGISVTNFVQIDAFETHYVSLTSTNPVVPYSSWATAATNIQNAVDAAVAGETVIVSNGVYAFGGRTVPNNQLTNRVVVSVPITLESVNGPAFTTIKGFTVPAGDNTDGPVRCVYLTNGAALIGFTLVGGQTVRPRSTNTSVDYAGAGAFCTSTNVVISNCVFSNNIATWAGGGVYGGTVWNSVLASNAVNPYLQEPWDGGGGACQSVLYNCLLITNHVTYGAGASGCVLSNCAVSSNYGTGAYECILTNCTVLNNYGGGAEYSTLSSCLVAGNVGSFGGATEYCTVYNCILSNNNAVGGGGDYSGIVYNSLLIANSASQNGGAAADSTLYNCTVVSNSAIQSYQFGGTYFCTNYNCIVMYNSGPSNFYGGVLDYCDTSPLPSGGVGNISANPIIIGSYHIASFSPCRGAGGTAYASGTDFDGEPWLNPPSIGCDEYYGRGPVTATISVSIFPTYTNIPVGYSLNLNGQFTGSIGTLIWNFGDGNTMSNVLTVSHAWQAPGNYTVTLTAYNNDNPGGVSASVMVEVVSGIPTHFVSRNGTNPIPPFTSWATAATNIQNAVDSALGMPGEQVLVSNGVYNVGGHPAPGNSLTNRLLVNSPIVIQSINGPAATVIQGYQVTNGEDGDGNGAVRCVWLGAGATLSGFTLTNGATFYLFGTPGNDETAAGVFCVAPSCIVTNCIIVSNNAWGPGGGSYGGTFYNCWFNSNSSLDSRGGGAADGSLNNCLLTGNSAGAGGGAYQIELFNCTVSSNYAYSFGSGTYGCTNFNSIIYSNNNVADDSGSVFYYCCTPLPQTGPGNITNNPLFVNAANGNFRLQSNSPCINAGNNAYVTTATDLDGNPRISGGTVDIGAYEFQNPSSVLSYAWLQQYGLPTDGSADYADTDNNGMNNWQKWIAGLNPTNPASILQMMPPATSGSNIVVKWQSVPNIKYFIQRSANLTPPSFQTIATNIPGQTGTTSYIDTRAPAPGPWFYQVGVP